MKLYQLYVTIIFSLYHLIFLQFCTARWLPSAVTKNSKEHENGIVSITTKWILTKWEQNTQVSGIRPIWASCIKDVKTDVFMTFTFLCTSVLTICSLYYASVGTEGKSCQISGKLCYTDLPTYT